MNPNEDLLAESSHRIKLLHLLPYELVIVVQCGYYQINNFDLFLQFLHQRLIFIDVGIIMVNHV